MRAAATTTGRYHRRFFMKAMSASSSFTSPSSVPVVLHSRRSSNSTASTSGRRGGCYSIPASSSRVEFLRNARRTTNGGGCTRVRASTSSSSSSSSSSSEGGEEMTRIPRVPKTGPKQRLDELTLQTNPELSRNVVQSWIQQGKVLVDGEKITKPGTKLKPNVTIEVLAEEPKFVCRGGLKLEKALQFFEVDVRDKICLDSGLSTGGFTDCLLQQGAKKVYGVDVGYGQVHEKIRTDERVVVMERQNLRYLESLPDLVEVVTLDLSFISVLKVLPSVAKVSKPNGDLIVLIKPQFEAKREQIGSKGVVRDTKVHEEVIHNVIEGAKTLGYEYINHTVSPIKGAKEGNTEFLGHFRYKA